VAEIVGDALPLRVAAVNRHGALFGPVAQGPAGIERRAPAFGLASQHKAPLALVAAAHGEERLCDRAAGGIRNAAGSSPVTACEPGRAAGWVAADMAMGRSLNLPWIDLVARHRAEVDALERALGLLGHPAGPAETAMGLGRTAPPERFMSLMAAYARAAAGEPARTEGLSLFAGQPMLPVDLAAMGYAPAVSARAARMLAAPLEPEGTLRALPPRLAPLGCRGIVGKSGTAETEAGAARARSATIVAECGGRRFVVFAMLDSGRGDRALGQIRHSDLAALIAAALGPLARP
jgi:hypothetical protein